MTYIVAEIGQNHQGSVDVARALVDMCAEPAPHVDPTEAIRGVDAVKLTKRDLAHEATPEYMLRPYNSRHSFGPTYGEHRAALELSAEEHAEVYTYAKARGLDFIETLCHPSCVDEIFRHFEPDWLKVASRDLTNIPLIKVLGETRRPMILSTGMADWRDIAEAIEAVGHDDITLLHCVSAYPADMADLNLMSIPTLKDQYGFPVGYSDHSVGIVAPVIAVTLGAEVIEKHVTLDRAMRGSDHAGSLERDGLWRMVRDIRATEQAMGHVDVFRSESSEDASMKLERSVCTSQALPEGTVISEEHLQLLSPGTGLRWRDRHEVVGGVLNRRLGEGEQITPADLTRESLVT